MEPLDLAEPPQDLVCASSWEGAMARAFEVEDLMQIRHLNLYGQPKE